MAHPDQQDTDHLSTSHSSFTRPSTNPSYPPVNLLLRGVNLSSTAKYPPLPGWDDSDSEAVGESSNPISEKMRKARAGAQSHLHEKDVGFWSEAEAGGRDGWFVGRPLMMDEADVHLNRLRAYGFTTLRYLVTWEALEHACPGKYDETFINYTITLLRKCKAHGFRVFISPHQDVFSRFISGSGAPYWVLLAMGLHPRRIHQTGSGVLHNCWETDGYGGTEGRKDAENGKQGDWPDMIWNTNLHRMAARHCFTMFFASEVFAPKCTIDDVPVGKWMRDHFDSAYGHLADRLREAGGLLDECVIGWDSMNEPFQGFVGTPDLADFPPSQSFRKGASPTPIQGFLLGQGRAVSDIQVADFTSLGQKKKGTRSITPPNGDGVWLTRDEARQAGERWGWRWGKGWDFWDEDGRGGCVWAGHGVWDTNQGTLLKSDYFAKSSEGKEYDFIEDFWRPHYVSFISRIRKAQPNAISFVNPPVFEAPPDLSEDVKNGRVALSAHFYDGLTLLAKRRHKYNADAVGLQRGLKGLFDAIKIGPPSIQTGLREQLGELKGDAQKSDGIAGGDAENEYPTIIGEIGVPFDMKQNKLFGLLASGKDHQKDYRQVAKAMDEILNACDGKNALSYTLWVYEPTNTHENGDGWNGEDLSIISFDDAISAEGKNEDRENDYRNPRDLSTLLTLGSRAIESWCRPYPLESTGRLVDFSFEMQSTIFDLTIRIDSKDGEIKEGYTMIYLPYIHYRQITSTSPTSVSDTRGEEEKTSRENDHVIPKSFASSSKRLLGKPHCSGFVENASSRDEGDWDEWVKGQGPVVVDIEVLEISQGGRLEIVGQWGIWKYPLSSVQEERVIGLKIRAWRNGD